MLVLTELLDDQLSMVVFNGDLDRLLAAWIIATGVAAIGVSVRLLAGDRAFPDDVEASSPPCGF